MGICSSLFTTQSTPKTDDDRAAIAQREKQQRQEALWINGVLVPPMFGIPTDTRITPSVTLNTAGNISHETPIGVSPILLGYVDYLRTQSDLSYRLLHTNLQSGLWITSFTPKNSVRVGIFDATNMADTMKGVNDDTIRAVTPLERSETMSSEFSDDDDSTLRLKQFNSNKNVIGGQVTLERQFIDRQGRNYGSIHCHTDPTNMQFPYSLQVVHRPIPWLSLFGVFTSSSSPPPPPPPSPAAVLSSKQILSSSAASGTNGFIGAQISHSIPLFPCSSCHRYHRSKRGNATGGASYVVRATNDDDREMHCNLGIYLPIHWEDAINALDTLALKSITKTRNSEEILAYLFYPYFIPYHCDRNSKSKLNSKSKRPQSLISQLLSSTNEVNGCASVRLLGATAAIQGSMPMSFQTGMDDTTDRIINHNKSKYVYKTSSYFSTSINDEVTNLSPIQLTIQQQNLFGPMTTTSNSSISVSQIITFQRYHFNVVDEYRAPYVHNTLAWTIQMESLSTTGSTSSLAGLSVAEDSGEHNMKHYDSKNNGILMNRMNRVSLGLAWQLNRNVALKAVLYPQSSSYFNENVQSHQPPLSSGITATTAILFKRWYYPRITCSILHKWSFHDPTKNRIFPTSQFAGIGIDIETGDNSNYYSSTGTFGSSTATSRSRSVSSSNDSDDDEDNMGSPKLHPPTISVLPEELYKLKQRR